jgi:phosphonate transport system substrate-binding protein
MGAFPRLLLLCALLAATPVVAQGAFPGDPQRQPMRIGITPVFLDSQTGFLDRWRAYLETRLGRSVQFVQRSTYRQVIELLLGDEIDFAWICGYPFLQFRADLELVAVPLYRGEPYYRSYLIVSNQDTETRELADLRGRIFAYADPDSNSGYLVPQAQIKALGANRETFFRKSFFTWAHAKVVRAVADGLANGGAVDGYVWETLAVLEPELTRRTRVVSRSQRFGFPPFVARSGVAPGDRAAMRDALIGMADDADGRGLLGELHLDGFSEQQADLYDGIRALMLATGSP